MLREICILCILFIVGIFAGLISIIIGIKGPLKNKEYFNYCDNCNHKYKWYEMIPLFSYILAQGKCKYCLKKKTIFYPILELISGLLFTFSFIIYGFSYEMLAMIVLTILSIIIYVSDFKYFIILNEPLIVFSIVILGLKFYFYGFETFLISVCSGILIFLFMFIIKYGGDKIFKQESLGGGDVKLSMFFGFMFGVRLSIVSLIIGSFLAFPYAVYSALTNKNKEIPFGPFLVTSLYLVFVFMEPINNFITVIFK